MKFSLDDLHLLGPCDAGQETAYRRVSGGTDLTLQEWVDAGIPKGHCIWTMQQRARVSPEVFERFKVWAVLVGAAFPEDADVEAVIHAMDRATASRVLEYITGGMNKAVARASIFDENWEKLLEAFAD